MRLNLKRNLGPVDRYVRGFGGLGLIALWQTRVLAGGWGVLSLVVGVFLVVEAAAGY